MTYCLSMLLDTGLVFLSDSRTNAGIDHVSTFRKTTVFEKPGDRVLVLLTAGNLAATQSVCTLLAEDAAAATPDRPSLMACSTMHHAACLIGSALRRIHERDGEALQRFGYEFNPAIILGGQIRGEKPRLFNIYAAGNFIEATPETTYFQVGESKYGKPIIDRVIRRSSSLSEAVKCALVSMDSTIRSNLSVGLPLDLVIVKRDEFRVARHTSIDQNNAYFRQISSGWGEALRNAFVQLPDHDWLGHRG
jgi:putative proteasome-type protease